MIENLSFQDIKMFKGKHSVEFKPLTIFTGANNAGKSTLMVLIGGMVSQFGEFIGRSSSYIKSLYPLSEESSGTNTKRLLQTKKEDTYVEVFKLQNLFLDDISSMSSRPNFPEKTKFYYKKEPVIVYDPLLGTFGDDDFYTTITIDLEKTYSLFLTDKSQNEKKKKTIAFLKKHIRTGFPKEIFKTYLIDVSIKAPLFEEKSNNGLKKFSIRIYESFYYHITNTKSNDFLFFYCNTVFNSVRNNTYLENEFSLNFLISLSLILKEVFLFPLKKQADNFNNLVNLSAYRGRFINETKSEAYEILTNLIGKESDLLVEDRWADFFASDKFYQGTKRLKENKLSKIKFLKKWTSEFGLGTAINFEKKPINLLTISQSEKVFRYPFELGFGNQQFLPILLAICTKKNGLFLIEEPESHLHPNLQSKLADFFTDALKNDKGSQFIIETHSEYFIRKLQFLIAKGLVDKDMIALYYIHNATSIPKDCKQVQRMEIRDDGIIKQGFGSGFFDESAHLAMDLLNIKKSN